MALDEEAERRSLCEWQPHLESRSFEVKSPTDRGYNCIAWAAGDDTKIWSPAVAVGGKMLGGYYWPDVPTLPTVTAAEALFERGVRADPCRRHVRRARCREDRDLRLRLDGSPDARRAAVCVGSLEQQDGRQRLSGSSWNFDGDPE